MLYISVLAHNLMPLEKSMLAGASFNSDLFCFSVFCISFILGLAPWLADAKVFGSSYWWEEGRIMLIGLDQVCMEFISIL
jgi:hypothetical protein